jgi:hypothetical protein
MLSLVGNPSGAVFVAIDVLELLVASGAGTEAVTLCGSVVALAVFAGGKSETVRCEGPEAASVLIAEARWRYRERCSFRQPKYPAGPKASRHTNVQRTFVPAPLGCEERGGYDENIGT